MAAAKIHHVSIQGDTGEDAESDTVDSEYARHAAAFAAARKRKASYHYQGKNCTVYTCLNLDLSPSCDLDTGKSTVFILLFSFLSARTETDVFLCPVHILCTLTTIYVIHIYICNRNAHL